MTETVARLSEILGPEYFDEITTKPNQSSGSTNELTNAKAIYCQCKTLVLKPDQARLILPSESMLPMERELNLIQPNQNSLSNLRRGCYWLVDDMYKFEQIGYSKETNTKDLIKKSKAEQHSNVGESPPSQDNTEKSNDSSEQNCVQFRYLVCAECNLCPLGWFDPNTKESYLYVW